MITKSFLTIIVLVICQFCGNAFVTPTLNTKASLAHPHRSQLFLSDNKNEEDRLRALGYSEDEIRRSKQKDAPTPPEVRVDLVDGIDAVTLTAVGFGLIAFNFFVFANAGDGGIAGVVATIINTMRNWWIWQEMEEHNEFWRVEIVKS